MVYREISH